MPLSNELVNQFVKVTNDTAKDKKESTVYGMVPYIGSNGTWWLDPENPSTDTGIKADPSSSNEIYVHIDGAFQNGVPTLVRATTTVAAESGNRVIIAIKNHMAVVTGNMTDPSTTETKTVTYVERKVEETVTNKISTHEAEIEKLKAKDVEIDGVLEAQSAVIEGKIDAKVVEADYALIEEMDARYGEFNTLAADYASFKETFTENADIQNLSATVARIQELIYGSASGESMHADFANAVVALIGEAAITSAMIANLDAAKINAGVLNTQKVSLESSDGSLVIKDSIIQIKDEEQAVRVQIGKDGDGNYSVIICDSDGNIMFDSNGITEYGIRNPIIDDSMIISDACISGSKIDVNSLMDSINDNGTSTINSSRIYLDSHRQELNAAFTTLHDTVYEQGISISLIHNKFSSKVWSQDIDAAKTELKTQYSTLEQDVEGVRTTVGKHATQFTEADTELEAMRSTIAQLVSSISMLVTDGKGSSLMTQTEDGWTFSTSSIEERLVSVANALDTLNNSYSDTEFVVTAMQHAVSDITRFHDHIRIGTYENEPCIELGESDSDFKLRITNTRIMFFDGSDVPAYINDKSLNIKKAVIEEELHQGGYAWVTRSNGHLSLVWKGYS